jgi:phospholipid/cholesterol/gamma-HCH transport system substrate-binding protein
MADAEESSGNTGARIAAVGLLALVVVIAAVVVLTRADPYRVTATFTSASQLVKGNLVQVAGEKVGTVEEIELTDDGRAKITFTVNDDFSPLRTGTRAVIRQLSLSGVANRYIDLQLGGARGREIEAGGQIPSIDAEAAVDLDEFFNTFDEEAREGVRGSIRFFRDFNAGHEDEAREAIKYANPALNASSRLFAELNRNRPELERFITETAALTTDLAARDEELAGLVTNLATTMDALASRRQELGEAVNTLPRFMRRANTTFVNLRAALDDLDPLVEDAKPVVRNDLRPLFAQLRPFARDAGPTVRDLSRTIRQPGPDNDLIDLLNRQPAVDAIANRRVQRNGRERKGAFQQIQDALPAVAPQLQYFRAYAPEIIGWFDDFSTSGVYDALGGFSRSGLAFSAFSFTPAAGDAPQRLLPVPPEVRNQLLAVNTLTGRDNRCPGSLERNRDGSNPYKPSPDFGCDETMVPPGP